MSLLIRLSQPASLNEEAWREFVDLYAPLIYHWCLHYGTQEADAQDVTQDVLLKLAVKMPSFTYDPVGSFRSWLRTVTSHAWADFHRERTEQGSGSEAVACLLASVEAQEDLLSRLEQTFDLEILEKAIVRVRDRVEPSTWEAFYLTAYEGVPAAEVSRRLRKKIGTIYVSRNAVQKMIREEIALLETIPRSGFKSDYSAEMQDSLLR